MRTRGGTGQWVLGKPGCRQAKALTCGTNPIVSPSIPSASTYLHSDGYTVMSREHSDGYTVMPREHSDDYTVVPREHGACMDTDDYTVVPREHRVCMANTTNVKQRAGREHVGAAAGRGGPRAARDLLEHGERVDGVVGAVEPLGPARVDGCVPCSASVPRVVPAATRSTSHAWRPVRFRLHVCMCDVHHGSCVSTR